MTTNPLTQLEDKKAWTDMGKCAWYAFSGARSEGASTLEAYISTAALFRGILDAKKDTDPDDD